jgi:hypothetical protein
VAGDRNPDFTLGISNSFTFKGLSVNFLLDVRRGGDVWNGNAMYLFRRGHSPLLIDDREKPYVFKGVMRDGRENSDNPTPNNIAIVPQYNNSFFTAFSPGDFVEKDINWLRLRDVTLSYELPSRIVAKSGAFRSAKLFVTGTDLFILTNYTGADPAVSGNSVATPGSGAAGLDYGSLANPRAVSFGLRVTL